MSTTKLKRIEIDISVEDLARAIAVIQSLSFSQIQTTVANWDVNAAYASRESLLKLREQLELRLGAIELARELFANDGPEECYHCGGTLHQPDLSEAPDYAIDSAPDRMCEACGNGVWTK